MKSNFSTITTGAFLSFATLLLILFTFILSAPTTVQISWNDSISDRSQSSMYMLNAIPKMPKRPGYRVSA